MLRAVRGPLLIVVLIALLLVALWFWIRTSLPELQGSVELPGLAATVEITRDEFGVPSIEAQSQEDLYYALGFVHAQDRIWQMEHRRRLAAGRLAELLGEEALASDLLMRTLGLRQAAERDVAGLSARASGTLQAYSDGVNGYLATRSGALPLEFQLQGHVPEEWTPVDVALLQKLTAWQWSSAAAEELFRARLVGTPAEDDLLDDVEASLDPEVYARLPLAQLDELIGESSGSYAGSQAWLVGADKSGDGVPLLAVEGRGPLTAPTPWYLVRMKAPGLNLAGATLPGMPLVFSGRNEQIAWALVPTPVDNADLYLEQLIDSDDPASGYLTPEGAGEFELRRELVTVRGADDVELIVRRTVHGQVISDLVSGTGGIATNEHEHVVALSWTALREGDGTLPAALALASASNWQEFRGALSGIDELHGTALYADTRGGIGWQAVGRRPERSNGSGDLPEAGRNTGWEGWIPFANLESMLESDRGTRVFGGADTASIEELLTSLGSHTVLSSARILGMEYLHGTDSLLPVIKATVPSTELARQAHAELVGWSGELGEEGVAPLVYSAWLRELSRELLSDELGAELAAEATAHPRLILRALSEDEWCDYRGTEEHEACVDVSTRALTNAVASLAERYGPRLSEWPEHPAARVAYHHPVFGGTLLAPLFSITPNGDPDGIAAGRGPIYRAVYQLTDSGNWGSSGFLTPTGQSGNPLSHYYRNLTDRWGEARLLPLMQADAGDGTRLLLEPRR